jgi:hypothetical protein
MDFEQQKIVIHVNLYRLQNNMHGSNRRAGEANSSLNVGELACPDDI